MHRHLARVEREFQGKWDAIVPGADARAGTRRTTSTRKNKPVSHRVS